MIASVTTRRRRQAGFTLMEVVIALAIVATTLAGVVRIASTTTMNTAHLRDKTLAHWVATNLSNQMHIRNQFPATGERTGTEEMARREWHWRRIVSRTEDSEVRKVVFEVRAAKNDDDPVASLTTYAGKP